MLGGGVGWGVSSPLSHQHEIVVMCQITLTEVVFVVYLNSPQCNSSTCLFSSFIFGPQQLDPDLQMALD